MAKNIPHATHPDVVKRLKRANGHLLSVINKIEGEQPCIDIAQQLHVVEKAIVPAKRTLIQDYIDHYSRRSPNIFKAHAFLRPRR